MSVLALGFSLWFAVLMVWSIVSAISYTSPRYDDKPSQIPAFNRFMAFGFSIYAMSFWSSFRSGNTDPVWLMVAIGVTALSAIFTSMMFDDFAGTILNPYIQLMDIRFHSDWFIHGAVAGSGGSMRDQIQAARLGKKILKRLDGMGYKETRYFYGWLPYTRHVRFSQVLIDPDRIHFKIALVSRKGHPAFPSTFQISDLTSERLCEELSEQTGHDVSGYTTESGSWLVIDRFPAKKKKRSERLALKESEHLEIDMKDFYRGMNRFLGNDK